MNDILKDREKRLEFIQSFFNENKDSSLIVVKANIPGPKKQIPIAYHLVRFFKNLLIDNYNYKFYKFIDSFDGPYYMLISPCKDISLKHTLVEIETTHPLGRLIDLDLFFDKDASISRNEINIEPRKCLICQDYAHICARSQKHSLDELTFNIEKTFLKYYMRQVVTIANDSILTELNLENKFGLVTPTTNGSHDDMDYHLMIKAKDSLVSYFEEIFEIGFYANNLNTILDNVRNIGIVAEEKMFAATNGVNCYKGVIFLLGITLLALGYTFRNNINFDDIFLNTKTISKNIYKDFNKYNNTVGTKLYKEREITGIRGIVYDGLEVIKKHLNTDISSEIELLNVLYQYIISIEDTVFIKRSQGYENYLRHKSYFETVNIYNEDELQKLNNYSINHKLSFGGSADLLIITIFFIKIKHFFK